jgi:hypothetical protein
MKHVLFFFGLVAAVVGLIAWVMSGSKALNDLSLDTDLTGEF